MEEENLILNGKKIKLWLLYSYPYGLIPSTDPTNQYF